MSFILEYMEYAPKNIPENKAHSIQIKAETKLIGPKTIGPKYEIKSEYRGLILKLILANPKISTKTLVNKLGISEKTVRQLTTSLMDEGLIPLSKDYIKHNISQKQEKQLRELNAKKKAIANRPKIKKIPPKIQRDKHGNVILKL